MPKIEAPTLAEHHARRRASLLAATRQLLASGRLDSVNLAAVGAAAGLARSSVYQYFDSTADLLLAVVEESFEAATAQLQAAMADAATPREQVNAYVLAMLSAATDETHRSIATLSGATLPESARSRVAALHAEQERPLVAALAAMGMQDADVLARLVQGVIGSATSQINRGVSRAVVTEATLRLIHGGLAQPAPSGAAGGSPAPGARQRGTTGADGIGGEVGRN